MSEAMLRGASRGVRQGERRRLVGSAAAVVLAVLVGALVVVQPGAAAAASAALALGALLLLARSRPDAAVELEGRRFRWVTLAWVFLLTQPIGHFTTGRTALTAVSGAPSVENVIELTVYGAIGASSIWSLRRNGFGRRPEGLLLALSALALLSTAWSLAQTVTLGFSFELIAIVLLSTLTSAIVSVDPSVGRSIMRRTLRLTVVCLAILCVVGLLFQSDWVTASPDEARRFTWPGGHPLYAAAEIGIAVIITVFTRRSEGGFTWPVRIALLALFAECLYLANARTAFAGLAAAGLFGYWFRSKAGSALHRLAGMMAIALSVFMLVSAFAAPLTEYLYRGESQQQVYGLNGRLSLWTQALQQVHSPGRWLVGYGLGGTRVVFSSSSTFAADAHSAWLELLLSLGLVGAVVGVAVVGMVAVRLFRIPRGARLPNPVLPILFVYALAMSPVGAGFAIPGPEPGLGFAVLGVCYAASAARKRVPSRSLVREGPTTHADVGLVPA